MPKIVTTEQMRAIEQAADAQGHSYADMMEFAGRAVAERIKEIVLGYSEPRILVLTGPGNNGGDGLVVARILAYEVEEASVSVFMLKARSASDDPVFAAAEDAPVTFVLAANDKQQDFSTLHSLVSRADVVVDALFGTSVHLPLAGDAAAALRTVHDALAHRRAHQQAPPYTTPADPVTTPPLPHPVIVAVDCPSGLYCDTGEIDALALHADETITFAAAKPGLLTFPGADVVGTLHIGHIGLPPDLPELQDITLTLADAKIAGAALPKRSRAGHKGTFGKSLVVAGSLNYIGAPYLAAHAAYRVGAGLVTVAAPQVIVPTLAAMLPEATWLLLPHNMGVINVAAVKVLRKEINGYKALLVGPGFGAEDVTGEFLGELLEPKHEHHAARRIGFALADADAEPAPEENLSLPPLVLDADALNLLAKIENWPAYVPPNTILTPHPAEFGRLSGLETAEVQANRLALAQQKAVEWGCIVVLKGAFTVVAAPDKRVTVLPFATSALATAGTGDVLAGAIVGLLAQGLEPFDAAVTGGWLHGMAGARTAWMLDTEASVTAGDVSEMLPVAMSLAEQAVR